MAKFEGGFGMVWTDDVLYHHLKNLNRLEIISVSDTIILTKNNEMFTFLRAKRKGLLKKRILIKIK